MKNLYLAIETIGIDDLGNLLFSYRTNAHKQLDLPEDTSGLTLGAISSLVAPYVTDSTLFVEKLNEHHLEFVNEVLSRGKVIFYFK